MKFNGRSAENYDQAQDAYAIEVPADMTARRALGAAMRENYTRMFGHDHSEVVGRLLD